MTRQEFSRALEIANSNREFSSEEYNQMSAVCCGFGLSNFNRVNVTLDTVAMLIRYQCQQMNGFYDLVALDQTATACKRAFEII